MPTQSKIMIRDVLKSDLPTFFEQQKDEEANFMAAFTGNDPEDQKSFLTHWHKVLNDESMTLQTILVDGEIAGHIEHFPLFGLPSVGYWIGKEFWGKGITTTALGIFLEKITERPVYARVAHDNKGSIRVLEKNGFVRTGEDQGFANARGCEIKEYIYCLQH